MAKKPSKRPPKVSLTYSSCVIVTNMLDRCPFCGAKLQPMVRHECSRKEPK